MLPIGSPYQPAFRRPSVQALARFVLTIGWVWVLSLVHWIVPHFVADFLAPISAAVVAYWFRLRLDLLDMEIRFRRRWARGVLRGVMSAYFIFACLAWFVSTRLRDLGVWDHNAIEMILYLDVVGVAEGMKTYASVSERTLFGLPITGALQWGLFALEAVWFALALNIGAFRRTPLLHCPSCDRRIDGSGAWFAWPGEEAARGARAGQLEAFVASKAPVQNDKSGDEKRVFVHVYRCPKCLASAPAWVFVRRDTEAHSVPVVCDFELAGTVDRRIREGDVALGRRRGLKGV